MVGASIAKRISGIVVDSFPHFHSLAITGGTDWTTALDLDKEAFELERGQWDPMSISNEILEEAVN